MQNERDTKSPSPGVANWSPEGDQHKNFMGAKAKKIHVKDDISNVDRVVMCFAEFCGTTILVFLGCMACMSTAPAGDQEDVSFNTGVAFAFGLAVMVSVQCFGHISGCHINPAVTFASVILGHTPIIHIPFYIIGQMLGGVGGYGLLKVLCPSDPDRTLNPCSPSLGKNVEPWQGLLIECGLTFILCMVCASAWDCRNARKPDSIPLRVGLTITVLALSAGPYTGAHMNPARTFGPAVINGTWESWWVFWVGPLSGAVLAALLYRFIFSREQHVDHNAAEIIQINERA